MAPLTKAFLFVSLALSASALSTPHVARGRAHHDLAARVAEPAPVAYAEAAPAPRKRSNNKRCSPRLPSSVISSSVVATSTIVNVGSSPSLSSSSPEATSTPAVSSPPPPSSTPSSTPPATHTHTTTTAAPPPPPPSSTTSAAPPATSSASSSYCDQESYLCGEQTGQGTFYATGLGACGITNVDTDYICAVSHLLFDTYPGYNGENPNNNPVCGKKITANYQGKSVTVTVTDRCTGCDTTSLDFSPSAFDQLADPSVGRLFGMTWNWDN